MLDRLLIYVFVGVLFVSMTALVCITVYIVSLPYIFSSPPPASIEAPTVKPSSRLHIGAALPPQLRMSGLSSMETQLVSSNFSLFHSCIARQPWQKGTKCSCFRFVFVAKKVDT